MQTILLIDDDATFRDALGRALTRRGYDVACADSAARGLEAAQRRTPDAVVLDLSMPGPSGLTVIAPLRALGPHTRILVLTGYASIATAVEAVKLGADQYLAKPAGTSEILQALGQVQADPARAVAPHPMSVRRLEWEHIQRVLQEHGGNVSAAARALHMHRRTLQRKLGKRPVAQ